MNVMFPNSKIKIHHTIDENRLVPMCSLIKFLNIMIIVNI